MTPMAYAKPDAILDCDSFNGKHKAQRKSGDAMSRKQRRGVSSVRDLPVTRREDDCLSMSTFSDALSKFIEGSQTPITIALQGEWGCGKTSMMNSVRSYLTDENRQSIFVPIWVNTWNHALIQDESALVVAILQDIIRQIREKSPSSVKEVADRILKSTVFLSKTALSVAANVLGFKYLKVGGFGSNAAQELFAETNVSIPKLRAEIASLVAEMVKARGDGVRDAKIVFFIDDLDRIKPEVAVLILEVMKNLFDIENCIFILSLDWNVVVKGLKPKFGEMTDSNAHEFHDFFDKIIQVPVSMPTSAYNIDELLKKCLLNINFLAENQIQDPDLMQALSDFAVLSVGTNPRTVKRLVNYLSLIMILVKETEQTDDDSLLREHPDIIFALVCLQIRYPDVYRFLERQPNFPNWDDALANRLGLPSIVEAEMKTLLTTQTFDDPWEQVLYRVCKQHSVLMPSCHSVSSFLNLLWNRLKVVSFDASVGRRLMDLLKISSITSLKGQQESFSDESGSDTRFALHRMRHDILTLTDDRGAYLYTGLDHVDFGSRQKIELRKEGNSASECMKVGAFVKASRDDEPPMRVVVEMLIAYEANLRDRKYVITGRIMGYDWKNTSPFELDLNKPEVVSALKEMNAHFADYFKAYPITKCWTLQSEYDDVKGFGYCIEIPYGEDSCDIRDALHGSYDAMAKNLYRLMPYLSRA